MKLPKRPGTQLRDHPWPFLHSVHPTRGLVTNVPNMTRPYHPTFPEGGWHCVKCNRPFGFFIQTCPYCLVDKPRPSQSPQRKPLPLQLKRRETTGG